MPTDPTPEAMEKAREIVDAWFRVLPVAKRPYLESLNVLYPSIARAIDAARRVPEGHVREGVTDRKVLGTLPVTADGCVATINGTFYTPRDDEYGVGLAVWAEGTSPVGSRVGFRVSYVGCDRTWMSNQCYSTRTAAEAAKQGGE